MCAIAASRTVSLKRSLSGLANTTIYNTNASSNSASSPQHFFAHSLNNSNASGLNQNNKNHSTSSLLQSNSGGALGSCGRYATICLTSFFSYHVKVGIEFWSARGMVRV